MSPKFFARSWPALQLRMCIPPLNFSAWRCDRDLRRHASHGWHGARAAEVPSGARHRWGGERGLWATAWRRAAVWRLQNYLLPLRYGRKRVLIVFVKIHCLALTSFGLWNRRVDYWSLSLLIVHSFARMAHLFACSALLASLTHFGAHRKVIYVYELNALISFSFNP